MVIMRYVLFAAPLLGFLACSSSSDGGGGGGALTPQGLDDFCAHNCATEHKCLNDDQTTCESLCHNSLAAYGPKTRSDYFTAYSKCLDGVDCTKWATDSKACPSVAAASLAPSDAAKKICDDLAKKLKDCSQPPADPAKCLDSFKIFSDAAIGDASACLSQPCADYGKCVTAAIGGK